MDCPTCGGEAISICKCERRDSYCGEGHHWHKCLVHDEIILRDADHRVVGCSCVNFNWNFWIKQYQLKQRNRVNVLHFPDGYVGVNFGVYSLTEPDEAIAFEKFKKIVSNL